MTKFSSTNFVCQMFFNRVNQEYSGTNLSNKYRFYHWVGKTTLAEKHAPRQTGKTRTLAKDSQRSTLYHFGKWCSKLSDDVRHSLYDKHAHTTMN